MKKLSQVISITILTISFAFIMIKIQDIVNAKDLYPSGSTRTINGFYNEKKNDIEVIALGTSHSFCSFNPLVMYEDYGIASYCFSTPAQPLRVTQLYLEETLKTQNPKVICVEVLDFCNTSTEYQEQGLRWGLTSLKISKEKLLCLKDTLGYSKELLTYIFPFFRYKDRWKEVNTSDFVYRNNDVYDYSKGYNVQDGVVNEPEDLSYPVGDVVEILPQQKEVVRKMVKYCKDNNISLIFYNAPASGWTRNKTKVVRELADESEIPYIDFMLLIDELGFSASNDFGSTGHLNNSGAEKLSRYLGQYIVENYEVNDRRKDICPNSWDKSLQYQAQIEKNKQISECTNWEYYIQLISTTGYISAVVCNNDFDDNRLCLPRAEIINEGKCYKPVNTFSVDFGINNLSIYYDQGNNARILWNSQRIECLDEGINIIVYDKLTNTMVDNVGFYKDEYTGEIVAQRNR